jgi:hypothetical protein
VPPSAKKVHEDEAVGGDAVVVAAALACARINSSHETTNSMIGCIATTVCVLRHDFSDQPQRE